jgi:hypothetical protein
MSMSAMKRMQSMKGMPAMHNIQRLKGNRKLGNNVCGSGFLSILNSETSIMRFFYEFWYIS